MDGDDGPRAKEGLRYCVGVTGVEIAAGPSTAQVVPQPEPKPETKKPDPAAFDSMLKNLAKTPMPAQQGAKPQR